MPYVMPYKRMEAVMARKLRDAKLDTRSARLRLPARREPYWRAISQGLAIGYRRGKKGGTWIARHYTPDAGRRYKAIGTSDDVVDANGTTILNFAQAQERAHAWFREVAEEGASSQEEAARSYTVAMAVRDYLSDYEDRGGKAVQDARTRANALVLPQLGHIEIADLTAKQIRAWLTDLSKMPPRLRTRRGATQQFREIDPGDRETIRRRRATANRTFVILRAALNHAWAEGKATSDAEWRRVKPFRDADAARVDYLRQDQIARLVNACDAEFRPLVQAAVLTGCRYGEIAALRVADFNPDAGTVHVRQSKAGKARHVTLTDEGREFFEGITAGCEGGGLMFAHDDGKPWGRAQQQRPLRRACKQAHITPPANFHILRHSYASLLIMAGVPLVVIAENLGHADTRMCEKHYAHLAPSYVAETIRARAPKLGVVKPAKVTRLDTARP